jgi:O-antigen ligase
MSVGSRICHIVFWVYIIYMLLGASVPFQDHDPKDARITSNPINQVVDSTVPAVCLICLWPKRRRVLEILRQEKFLVLFLAWCAASILWSDFPFSSAKASVRMIGATIVVLAFLVNSDSPREMLKYFRIVLAIYIPLTFLAIALVPGATQWEWPAWRGLATQKNTLGEIALVSAIVWASAIRWDSIKRSLGPALFAAASLALLIGSKSVTCLITLAFISFLALSVGIFRRFGRAICTAAAVSCCVAGLLAIVNIGGVAGVFGDLGRDTSFTGRTDIWDVVLDEAKTHPVIGTGFAAFWTADNDVRVYPKAVSLFRPNEGHEGYLDLFNETGAVGLILLALMVICYFRNAVRSNADSVWSWLFVSVLLVNTMESTLFRAGGFTGWIFVVSYLAFYADPLLQERTARGSVREAQARDVACTS